MTSKEPTGEMHELIKYEPLMSVWYCDKPRTLFPSHINDSLKLFVSSRASHKKHGFGNRGSTREYYVKKYFETIFSSDKMISDKIIELILSYDYYFVWF